MRLKLQAICVIELKMVVLFSCGEQITVLFVHIQTDNKNNIM